MYHYVVRHLNRETSLPPSDTRSLLPPLSLLPPREFVYPYTGWMKGFYEDVWPFVCVLSLPIWYTAQMITVYLLVAMT